MSLVVKSDILCDDSTAHIVGHYLTVGSKHTAPRLSASARTYNVLAPCLALIIYYLSSVGSCVIEVVDDICSVKSTVLFLDAYSSIGIVHRSVCPFGSPAEL